MREGDRQIGSVTVLIGNQNGKYPYGNSLWIRGRSATAVVDPSLAVFERAGELGRADLIVQSHVHEDHIAGVCRFPEAEVYAHHEDAPGLRSFAGLVAIYGTDAITPETGDALVSQFHYTERPDVKGYEDGAVFDLGGTRIRAIHTPGHTRGHCVLLVEPEGILFLGDIDLSGFGPYYGDAWSNLADFERSLDRVRDVEARFWVSFHHVGLIDDRVTFDAKLDRFAGKIQDRELAMLEFLREPHTRADMVAHRFIYPAHADAPWVEAAEKRSIQQHLERLCTRGQIQRSDGGTYRAVAG